MCFLIADRIEIGNDRALVRILYGDKSPDVAAQVVNFVNQHRALAPQGLQCKAYQSCIKRVATSGYSLLTYIPSYPLRLNLFNRTIFDHEVAQN